jgi:hypothetical protein
MHRLPETPRSPRLGIATFAILFGIGALAAAPPPAAARVFVGIGVPFPGYYSPYPYYYPPPAYYPYYSAPAYYPPPPAPYYPPPASAAAPATAPAAAPAAAADSAAITYTARPAFTNSAGQTCREFQAAGGALGNACQGSDGQWRVAN